MNRSVCTFVAVAIALAGCALFAWEPVSAHQAETDGPFRFVAGWLEEPAVAGAQNALDLEIERLSPPSPPSPVLEAHKNLTATLTKGSASISPPLDEQFGRDGRYTFVVIPTEPGNYTLRLTGNLNGTAIDVEVVLDEVVTTSDLQFPRPTPGNPEGQIGALQGQVTALFVVATIGLILAGISTSILLRPVLLPLLKRR
jgi:hypothetical protein